MALRSTFNYETQAEERRSVLNFRGKLAGRIRAASGKGKTTDWILNDV
jgi:hypothetical protein